jgi:hypothetical protein
LHQSIFLPQVMSKDLLLIPNQQRSVISGFSFHLSNQHHHFFWLVPLHFANSRDQQLVGYLPEPFFTPESRHSRRVADA